MATVLGSKTYRQGYLQAVELANGVLVNVVTRFSGPGLGTDTELEAPRKLSEQEQSEALDAAALHDVASGPVLKRPERFDVVAVF